MNPIVKTAPDLLEALLDSWDRNNTIWMQKS
jgi:hypothetical protein